MAHRQFALALGYIRKLAGIPAGESAADGQLLERFALQNDEAAFEALMEQHGPMVWGLCQRILRDRQHAEDAFQATFLILSRKAGSIRRSDSVAGWLYRVAYRVALELKSKVSRRQTHERGIEDMPPHADGEKRDREDSLQQWAAANHADAEPAADMARRELQAVLDDELNWLPEKYRTPLVLCYWEGKTNEEAARQLGCPVGTISARLTRGRERLRTRLTHRGIALSVTALTALLQQNALSAAVPAAVVDSTIKAALLFAAGKAAAGVVSRQAVALAEGVVQSMSLTKVKVAASFLLGLGILAGGGTVLAYLALSDFPSAPAVPSARTVPFTADLSRLPRHQAQIYAAVKPRPEELKWQQIPWLLDHAEALRLAQQERRPLCVWVSAGDPLDRC